MTGLLKCDSGQPRCKFIQTGVGIKAVRETIPVSGGSWEYGTKKIRFLVSLRRW